jgi:hypothetical protein
VRIWLETFDLTVDEAPSKGEEGGMALRLSYRGSVGAAVLSTAFAVARALRAQVPDETSKDACRHAYESAQLLRRNEELLAAREQLQICGAESCPAIGRTDCVRWLAEVESGIPSVVFEARTSVGAVFDVSARIDGAERVKELDGRPLEVDPGLHTFSFDRKGSPPLEKKVILREGQKNQLVVADWTTPAPQDSLARMPRLHVDRPVPASAYVTAGIAALGFADFAIAGSLGNSLKSELEASGCAPFCQRDQVNALRTRYVIADAGLAVGVVELATTVVLYLTRPERLAPHSPAGAGVRASRPSKAFAAVPSPSGLVLVWHGSL